jgi:LysM repeat protein
MIKRNASRIRILALVLLGVLYGLSIGLGEGSASHVVKKGENLEAIAAQYGATVKELAELNGIDKPNQINVGQKLKLPQTQSKSSAPAESQFITIQVPKKATLYSLAEQYGIPQEMLGELNQLADNLDLQEGQTLKIPVIIEDPPKASSAKEPLKEAKYQTIKVKKGDKLFEYAQKYGIGLVELGALNGIAAPYHIGEGQNIRVPIGEPKPIKKAVEAEKVKAPESIKVVVKRGDSIDKIASRHGVKPQTIALANNLKKPYVIYPNQELTVPLTEEVAKKLQASARPKQATVRKGESLGVIAGRYGISAGQLAAFNGISNPNRIRQGQVLKIPTNSTSNVSYEDNLPSGLISELYKVRVKRGKWRYVVIHHTATKNGSSKGVERYHKEDRNMENGMAYHFLIGNGNGMGDGEVYFGSRWKKQLDGGHLRPSLHKNETSIGICLVGNFSKKGAMKPSWAQLKSLEALSVYLLRECGLRPESVTTHKGIHPGHTECPGVNFKLKPLLTKLGQQL